jgi:tetratricopeptide (TPR) repeat protein
VDAAERVAGLIPDEFMDAPGMTFLQHFAVRPLQMYLRFGLWDEILAAPAPAAHRLHARGLWHYARGRALAATGELDEARAQLARLRTIVQDRALEGLALDFNSSRHVLEIAEHVLAGVLDAAEGRYNSAVRHLRVATDLEDDLTYGEPPEWSIPVRHDLGAVLLAAGRPAEAEQTFREDLERFPENGWSLAGLVRALRLQDRDEEAREVEARFGTAWAHADLAITASVF